MMTTSEEETQKPTNHPRARRRSFGELLCSIGPVAVLIPHLAENSAEPLVAFPLGVLDVGIVRGPAPKGVREHAGEVVDCVRGSRSPLAFGPTLAASSLVLSRCHSCWYSRFDRASSTDFASQRKMARIV